MIVVRGGDLVLPDRVVSEGALVLEGSRIAAVETRQVDTAGATIADCHGCYVVPGFVDVHVHGVDGADTLDGPGAVAAIAARLPRYGVTAFCPTTVACPPQELDAFLRQVAAARVERKGARVLPSHLESNFINPDYAGAQPRTCLRIPESRQEADGAFTARDILDAIAASRHDVGIVTLAPELPGAIDLIRSLTRAGHRVSLGHSAADLDTAIAAIEAGACHATHLFNRMPPLAHRAPGLAGAVLAREDVAAELICDGVHVHPAMCTVAVRAKGTRGIMAITDGTAGSGLAHGASARLGGRPIHVRAGAAFLEDGTLAGSTLTMDRAFRTLVTAIGVSVVDAAAMCSTTPARELRLTGLGVLAAGATADVAVLDRSFHVVRTFIDGVEVWNREAAGASGTGEC